MPLSEILHNEERVETSFVEAHPLPLPTRIAFIGNYLPNTNAHYGNARFVNQGGGNYSLGSNSDAFSIGFSSINQGAMGLHPTTVHWY